MSDTSVASSPSWLDQLGGWFGGLFNGSDSAPDIKTEGSPATGGASGGDTSFNFSNLSAPSSSSGFQGVNFNPGSANMSLFTNPTDTKSVSAFLDPTSAASNISSGATGQTPVDDPNKSSSVQKILSSLGLGGASTGDLIKGAAAGGGLLYNLLSPSPSASAEKSLKGIAGQQSAQGAQLESYLANGTLPPGAQQWVDTQTAAQKAAIRGKYATLGMSGSTVEMQELNNVDQMAASHMFEIASQLLSTGIQETNASGTLYNYLMQAQNADQKEVTDAIQNFVGSLGGSGGHGTTIQIGK